MPAPLIESWWGNLLFACFAIYIVLYVIYYIALYSMKAVVMLTDWMLPMMQYLEDDENWNHIENFPRILKYTIITVPLALLIILLSLPILIALIYAGHVLLSMIVTYVASLDKSRDK